MSKFSHNLLLGLLLVLLFECGLGNSLLRARIKGEVNHLRVGQRVLVQGKFLREGVFLGNRIVFNEPAERDLLLGSLRQVDRQAGILHVFRLKVQIDNRTLFLNHDGQPLSLKDVGVGDWLEIEGRHIGKAAFLATQVRKQESSSKHLEGLRSEIQKVSYGRRTMCVILDMPVIFTKQVEVGDYRALSGDAAVKDVKRDDDDQHPVPLQIGNFLTVGGKVELELEPQQNLDLQEGSTGDQIGSKLAFRTEILAEFHPNLEAYAKLKLKHKPIFRSGDKIKSRTTVLVASEWYLTYRRLFSTSWRLQVGRQRFKDKREWIFDENLDAVRLQLDTKRLDVQFALVYGGMFSQANPDDPVNHLHFYFATRSRLARRTYLGGYFFVRKRRDRDEVLNWLGLSLRGRLRRLVKYWGSLATVFGSSQRKSVQGVGLDIGATVNSGSVKPVSFTVGFAYGSGDRDSRDNDDGSFRQTGLQDNSARIGGLKRIKYYGEVLKPELSNLMVATLGLGFRPTVQSSLEFVFHGYRQVVAQSFLRDSNLEVDPQGTSPDLGKELDVIYTLREIQNLDLTLILGYFRSGLAFGRVSSDVFLGKIKVQVFY